jgi:hypothetical protein
MTEPARKAIKEFLLVGLLDPRVAAEEFPFDRPTLRSEQYPDDQNPPAVPALFTATRTASGMELRWTASTDETNTVDYVVKRNGTVMALPTQETYFDLSAQPA